MLAPWKRSSDKPGQCTKKQRYHFAKKAHIVYGFSVIRHVRENWTRKKPERQSINHFELWCWKRLLRVPWTGRRSNQSVLQEISAEYSMHRKDWCWSWNSNTLGSLCEELNHWKRPWCWERLKAGEKGKTEDEVVGWHHWLNGHESEQALGDGGGQGSLACCSPWGHKESDMTEWLSNNKDVFQDRHFLNFINHNQ